MEARPLHAAQLPVERKLTRAASLAVRCAKLCVLLALGPRESIAEQPVMGMVPRWDGGHGIQAFYTYRKSSSILEGSSELANPYGLSESLASASFEGVYTWDRSVRATFKLPYLERSREVVHSSEIEQLRQSGWGDLKLALPLKLYFNRERHSGNWSMTPQVKLPTASSKGPLALGDGSVDYALGFGFEKENPYLLYNFGLTYWNTGSAEKPDRWEFESLVAWNFAKDKFLGLDLDGIWNSDSTSRRIETGPSFFWWIEHSVLMKIEYKRVLDERVAGRAFASGDQWRIGFGIVR